MPTTGDEAFEAEVMEVNEEADLALTTKLNTAYGKRLPFYRLKEKNSLIEEKGRFQPRAAEYFNKSQNWISNVNIVNNINTTLITRVIKLDYSSAREPLKHPSNKQELLNLQGKRSLLPGGKLTGWSILLFF